MKNLKIRVNSDNASEVVDLLAGLGHETLVPKEKLLREVANGYNQIADAGNGLFTTVDFYDVKEITLPELRAMANQDQDEPFLTPETTLNDQYAEIEQVRQSLKDNVNHPSHYTQGKAECIDALESATIGKSGIEAVCVANVIKYLWRYEEKNGLEDVKKAQFYLNRLLATLEINNG